MGEKIIINSKTQRKVRVHLPKTLNNFHVYQSIASKFVLIISMLLIIVQTKIESANLNIELNIYFSRRRGNRNNICFKAGLYK